MDARTVDAAAGRLAELRVEEREDFGVAALVLALSLLATQYRPSLAVPLFLGGVGVAALGVRAVWRRWDLVYRLAPERDAYVIAEIREHALREASMDGRRALARSIRSGLRSPVTGLWARAELADQLAALASELDDEKLVLDPSAAVACARLLRDPVESPLLVPGASTGEVHARVRHIRSGFTPPRPSR